jgi:hypothetical protein
MSRSKNPDEMLAELAFLLKKYFDEIPANP